MTGVGEPADAARRSAGRPANLRDVAARAGVSLSTASRVLSGDYPIADATRERVVAAMKELDYSETRGRRREATRTVGVVVPDVRSPLVSAVTAGIDAAAAEEGRICMIFPTEGDPDRERDVVRLIGRQRELDALVFVGGAPTAADSERRLVDYATQMEGGGARLVLCARPGATAGGRALVVRYDNEGGVFALTGHLLARGHRRVAWIGGYRDYTTTDGRVAGMTRALAAHGLEPVAVMTEPMIDRGSRRSRPLDETYMTTHRLMQEHPEVTAIVAYSDAHAVEVIRALGDLGLSVPGDVSVVGHDDDLVARQIRPALTTVHLPMFELGWEATRLGIMKPEPGAPGSTVELGTHVVVRDSVADPRR